jgi:hypothetical protein
VLLRATTTPGRIVIRARAKGLAPAELTLASAPVAVKDGLGPLPPAPPAHLDRGPTPATPSFAVSRVAVPVAAVDAPDGMKSIDDDEMTAWTSRAGAAPEITYTLARPARLAEVELKLTGWRERSYPLQIFVDGQEAWRGATPKSLGYVTLPLKPVQGRTVRIVLAGKAEEGGGMRLTEVANQANTATGTQGVSTATLSIVEAEFYERP